MCGIVGYVGGNGAADILLSGLRKLEYRGYDSAGIALINDSQLSLNKGVGKIDDIKEFVNLKGNVGIAHCRWATHGKVNKANSHPHCDNKEEIAIVHNGIIENYNLLKDKLIQKGFKFNSETDTEVIVHLIASHYKGDLKTAVQSTLVELEGAYALGIVSSKEPDKLIAARNESPLILGIGKNENFIASDVPAILEKTNKVIYLDNKEIAVLTKDNVKIFNEKNKEIKKDIETINWSADAVEKGGYEDFMLKEIYEQPLAVEKTIDGRIKEQDINLKLNLDFKDVQRIIIVACGTSWHSALVGEFMLESLVKVPVEVEYASEFRYRDPIVDENTIVIAISQSGETADTLAAMKEAKRKGAKILSICNVRGSSIARESDDVLYTYAGPEIGVASTKAFTSQIIALYLLTVHLGKVKGTLPKEQIQNRVRDLRKLPSQIISILENEDIEKLAKKVYSKNNALYLGRGINYPIALEGALKLKEVSYIHAEGYPAAEMKHGPIALIDKNMPVVFIATKDEYTYKKLASNIEEVKSRGGEIIGILSKGDVELAKKVDHAIFVPCNSYILNPVLSVIPLQLLSYYIAKLRDCDVDKPRNLAKSVTVE